jgi:hypothetical protein
MRGWSLRRAGVLAVAAAVLGTGCERSPAGPGAAAADYAAGLDWGAAGMPLMLDDNPLGLEPLLRRALRAVASGQGAEAAQALRSRLQPFHEAVRQAAQARDRTAFLAARAALRGEMAAIVVEVLGPDVPGGVIEGVARLLGQIERRVAEAHAAGRPTAVLEAMLVRAAASLAEARTALAAGNGPLALQHATEAALIAGRTRMRALGEVMAPAIPRLLQEAWEAALSLHGAAGAEALFAPLREKNDALRSALRQRDHAAVRAAQEALRAEQVRLMVLLLGESAPARVLDGVARLAEQRATAVEALAASGRDVSQYEAALREVSGLHADGVAALAAGELATALDLALDALEKVLMIRPHGMR